ncbi:hypothetical protein MPER_07128 [Moniliophthora perniciosa FA553]|nr:hypothetical protein MPER_07128 [Moniliophthora perniciosa FA553]
MFRHRESGWEKVLDIPPAAAMFQLPRLASTISTRYTEAAEEASILHTAAELQQELQLLPFGSLDNKSTTTLVSLYNAATAALASHLFSMHKCMRDYQEMLSQ